MDINMMILLGLGGVMILLIVLAFAGPSAERARSRRLSNIRLRHSDTAESALEARMRKAISNRSTNPTGEFLVSLIPNPENLQKRIYMTGRKWTIGQYLVANLAIIVLVSAMLVMRGWSPLMALLVAAALGMGLPHMIIGKMITRRIDKFNARFPDALELLVRGLRSGLPITETLGVVSSEVPGPVGEEFRLVTERIKIGQSMEQALQGTADRLGTPEFQFFCITLAIQKETGGNLAETLSNLATVLRQRAQMKLKIRAMSSESKASAYIIGVLPFLVFGLITWINFGYMKPFFTPDPAGIFGLSLMQLIGLGGLGWMSIGAFIMAQMINFEI